MKNLEEILDFPSLLQHLSTFASSEAGKKDILSIRANFDLEGAKRLFSDLKEILFVYDELPSFSNLRDVRELTGADTISPEGLLCVRDLLIYVEKVYKFLKHKKILKNKLALLFPLNELNMYIESIINEEGEIKENASQELKRIIGEINNLKNEITKHLSDFLDMHQSAIQDRVITQRMGRNVVPVKKERVSEIKGMVVDISGSGQTVFIEPERVIYLNNLLQERQIEKEREIKKILAQAAERIKEHADLILSNYEVLSYIDSLIARARFMAKYKGILPEFIDKPTLKIKSMRHPLLLLHREVVPQDLELGELQKTLLVSGPNAGGKTVLLKSIGLLVLSAYSGIPIIADEGTVIGKFNSIFAVIEDEQSIEQDLSTFSSHITRLKEILESAGKGSLILIDEIGGGTDPEEGSALGMAVLQELTERGCITIATTHFSRLKFFVANHKGMTNGAMDYSNGPTYHLIVGIPGGSMAIELAESMDIDKKIIANAKSFLEKGEMELNRLISELQMRLNELKEEKDEIHRRLEKAKSLESQYVELMSNFKLKEKEMLKKAKIEASEIIKRSRALVENTIREIKETQANKPSIKRYKKSFADLLEEMKIEKERESKKEEKIEPNYSIKVKVEKPEKLEIDVRGLFKEEAVEAVDRFIDKAYLDEISIVWIIHGKGSGILKNAIRNFLSQDKRVVSFYSAPPESGGEGVTVVKL